MIAPSLIFKPDGEITALGSGGSNRIRTAILQVIINFLDYGMPLQDAVTAPRIHFEAGRLDVEAGFDPDMSRQLASFYENSKVWDEKNMFFGGVHGVGFNAEKKNLWAAGDERRGGCALVLS